MIKVLMLHGINHNMFGKRDPVQYGTTTLGEIDARLQALGKELGVEVISFQTNGEKEMCERIHRGFEEKVAAVLITSARSRYRPRYRRRSRFMPTIRLARSLWRCSTSTGWIGSPLNFTAMRSRSRSSRISCD